jgi:hypothetical protein
MLNININAVLLLNQNKMTAVEWLEDNIERDMDYLEILYLIKQAKEMEKEQIIDAWDKRGDRIVPKYFLQENINGEQYYNETFKSE